REAVDTLAEQNFLPSALKKCHTGGVRESQ
ncbi:MAG: hypothetical protein RL187_956, partial [Actinomycetota bacterium]